MTEWFEKLPEQCPPKDAFSPNGQTFYRLVNGHTITSDDFTSQQAEFPQKEFFGVDKCVIKAVSIFLDKADCEKMLKFQRHKHKNVYALTYWKEMGQLNKPLSQAIIRGGEQLNLNSKPFNAKEA